MVRSFEIVETVPIAWQICCEILFKQPDLKRTFHTKRGDYGRGSMSTQTLDTHSLTHSLTHALIPHVDVVVSDWIEQADASLKRVCFYTMVENADSAGMPIASHRIARRISAQEILLSQACLCLFLTLVRLVEPILTRCLESQTLSIRRAPDGSHDEMLVSCSITPENAMMGNIFRIEAHWTITPSITHSLTGTNDGGGGDGGNNIINDNNNNNNSDLSVILINGNNDARTGSDLTSSMSFCTIVARGEVECTKRIWGLQGMAEKVLYQQVRHGLEEPICVLSLCLVLIEIRDLHRPCHRSKTISLSASNAPTNTSNDSSKNKCSNAPTRNPRRHEWAAVAGAFPLNCACVPWARTSAPSCRAPANWCAC